MPVSGQRRRHSLDVLASSTYAAAHLYVADAIDQCRGKSPDACPHRRGPIELVTDGKVYTVTGAVLQR